MERGKALSKLQLQEISPGSVYYVLDGTKDGVFPSIYEKCHD